jgi:crotonobetainyl-CoA:carnitine CoA-transferase CaiB-like acyl-CoA transferase
MADFGADVIKIEPPEGDPVRQMGQHVGDVSLYAASILRNKRSVVLDLKLTRRPRRGPRADRPGRHTD